MTLGGRAAEEIVFGRISTGAQNDLERITRMAYGMVTLYGMNKAVGPVSFNDPQGEYQFRKPYSEQTALLIDQEVRKIIEIAYDKTLDLIRSKREILEAIALELLSKEVIFKQDLERLAGPRPFEGQNPATLSEHQPQNSRQVSESPSTDVAAGSSTDVAAESSTDVAAGSSTGVAAESSTGVAAGFSTDVAAGSYTDVTAGSSKNPTTQEA
jgi:hypothetical protein